MFLSIFKNVTTPLEEQSLPCENSVIKGMGKTAACPGIFNGRERFWNNNRVELSSILTRQCEFFKPDPNNVNLCLTNPSFAFITRLIYIFQDYFKIFQVSRLNY